MTTETSKPHRLIFFKKDQCGPCKEAHGYLEEVLEKHPEYRQHVVVMQKENHSALVASYNLKIYPTVLVLDRNVDEMARRVGITAVQKDWWEAALTAIHNMEKGR